MGGQPGVPKDASSEVDGQIRLRGVGVVREANHAVHLAVGIEEYLVGEGSEADGAFEELGGLQFF